MSEPTLREWRFFIDDMISFSRKVIAYTQGLDQEGFVASELNYDATLRNLELIGEAATHAPEEVRSANPQIPWRLVIAARNDPQRSQLITHGDEAPGNGLVTRDRDRTRLPARIPEVPEFLSRAGVSPFACLPSPHYRFQRRLPGRLTTFPCADGEIRWPRGEICLPRSRWVRSRCRCELLLSNQTASIALASSTRVRARPRPVRTFIWMRSCRKCASLATSREKTWPSSGASRTDTLSVFPASQRNWLR